MAALATCLCQQINDSDVPGVCFCGVVPGEVASAEYMSEEGCGGMAWVRLITAYPSKVVGAQNTDPNNCALGTGVDLEVGIMRCTPVGDGSEPPTPAELLAATDLQLADIEVMLRAMNCCDAIAGKDMVVGPYQPLGPEGGTVGGVFTIAVAI